MWEYVLMGIEFFIGLLIAVVIIMTVYFLGETYWNGIIRYIKLKINQARGVTSSDPTICDKLGDVKIYYNHYCAMQELKDSFLEQEEQLYKLVEYIFPAPQITHNKFSNDQKRLHNAFFKQYRSLHIYHRAYPTEDDTSLEVINNGQYNLQQFYTALEDLIKELSSMIICKQPINGLMDDMEREKNSVREYNDVFE